MEELSCNRSTLTGMDCSVGVPLTEQVYSKYTGLKLLAYLNKRLLAKRIRILRYSLLVKQTNTPSP
jgi:hypothetical protein